MFGKDPKTITNIINDVVKLIGKIPKWENFQNNITEDDKNGKREMLIYEAFKDEFEYLRNFKPKIKN